MYHRLQNEEAIQTVQSPISEEPSMQDIQSSEEPPIIEEPDNKRGFIYPIRVAQGELSRHVNLLLTEKDGVWHYSTIKNFSGLLLRQYSKHKGKSFFCYSCLHRFNAKKGEKNRLECVNLQEHIKHCKTLDPQRVTYPNKKVAKFKNIKNMLKHPVVAYADFESCLQRLSDIDVATGVEPVKAEAEVKEKEVAYQEHMAASYFTKFVSIDPDFSLPKIDRFEFPQKETYVGIDAAEHFLDYVTKMADLIFKKYIETPKEMECSVDDEKKFDTADDCHICKKELTRAIPHCHNEFEQVEYCTMCEVNSRADIIVHDHDHILGTFRGAAHNSCNLQYSIDPRRWRLPIFLHSMRSYDGHLLIRALKRRHGKVRVIPTNMERYLAISVGRVQFLDSFQFTLQSLQQLVSTLDDQDFVETKKEFGSGEKFDLMRKKGVFPYDFFDDISKLKNTELPAQKEFYNHLEDKECSDKDYLRAKTVWEKFECKTLRDYHDLYLKGDVLLLADFFEKFRRTCLESYGIDSAHYYSTPNMAFDAVLKMTEVKLELFNNEKMYTFIEKAIRGGISQISKRYAVANNESMESYDPEKPLTHLIYLDANNLYGLAMSQPLPTGGFSWMSKKDIKNICIESLPDDGNIGYILEVDLEVPIDLHNKFNDYPLAVERLTIDESMLSTFQQNFPDHQKKASIKLTPNLYNKEKYIVHYRNLKFYLAQGLVLKKVHQVLKFDQSPWLKNYIDFNTKMRTVAKSDFEKDFYKLMNNAVFGKTQENLRNRMNVEVITERKIALKRACKPSMKRSQIIHEDLVIIQTAISKLELNKPIYVGFSVLELSKLHMYDFHYTKIREWFENVQLCFTDTDSLLYEIEGVDIYKVMLEHKDEFDFSAYPFEHPLYSRENKKKLGKFKDELSSLTLEEFIGLRSKCYSLLFRGNVEDNVIKHMKLTEKQVAKGTKKSVKKQHLRHKHYRDVQQNLSTYCVKQNTLKSKKHTISTYHQKKVSLTGFDTKRYILEDGVNTYAHGHYKTLDK